MIGTLKSTASIFARASKALLNESPNVFTQQKRTAVILRRMYPIRLFPKSSKPHKLRHRDFIYEVVENTDVKPKPLIDMILMQYVEGVGDKGNKIAKKPLEAYTKFLLPGLAVYASSENVQKYLKEKEQLTYSSKAAPLTMKYLDQCILPVNVSVDQPWTLEKWHIRANLRQRRIVATDESITLPEKEIKGPNLDYENNCFFVTITINKTETVKVLCRLKHVTYDMSKMLDPTDFWKLPPKALFEEEQELVESKISSYLEKQKKNVAL